MRNGYWKTLLSRLRGRVAQSNRVLHLGNVTFVLQEICASDDAPLDEGVDILLALDSHGNALLVDPANTEIRLRLVHAVEIIAPGFTLLDLIDRLQPHAPLDVELTALPEDQRMLDRLTRGKSSRGKGLFDDD